MFSNIFLAGLAALAPLAAAYTQPTGDAPVGNPISQPGLNSVVPVGKGFTITWNPTTQGTVTLVLLKGPSENAVPQYAIVEKTENDGSYDWTPSDDLEPTTGATGYGIQLIDDATGQYQYTTQFGISNPDYKQNDDAPSSSSSSTASSSKEMPTAYGPKATTTYESAPVYTTGVSSVYVPSGTANVTMVAPTGVVPSGTWSTGISSPNATFSAPAQHTGAASHMAVGVVGLVAAAGAVVFAI